MLRQFKLDWKLYKKSFFGMQAALPGAFLLGVLLVILIMLTDEDPGSWFCMGEERIGQGKDSVKAFLQANPEIAEQVEEQVREKLIAGAASRTPAKAAESPVAVSADDFDDED